ncbi:MAG TPA: cell division protein FtsL [Gammaproteobacteria bacterium]|nr:cell division protein FtsL [Gammaproteobacteria bacterium]
MNIRVLIAVLLLACMGSALAIVKSRHGNRTAFVELQKLEAERDALAVEWGQLQLEQSAWSTHARIEQVARKELDMTLVREARIVVSEDAD